MISAYFISNKDIIFFELFRSGILSKLIYIKPLFPFFKVWSCYFSSLLKRFFNKSITFVKTKVINVVINPISVPIVDTNYATVKPPLITEGRIKFIKTQEQFTYVPNIHNFSILTSFYKELFCISM